MYWGLMRSLYAMAQTRKMTNTQQKPMTCRRTRPLRAKCYMSAAVLTGDAPGRQAREQTRQQHWNAARARAHPHLVNGERGKVVADLRSQTNGVSD